MSLKQKQAHLRQKEYFGQQLKDRLALLSGKGIESARADKDPIVKKLKAAVRTVDFRLRRIAANEKLTEALAKMKAEKVAAAKIEKESGKPEKADKTKKAPEEAKTKKPKPEKKAGAPREPKEKGGEKAPKPAKEPQPEAPKEEKPQ